MPGSIPVWTLSDRLRKAREYAGLTQGELSVRIDTSRRSISSYEAGLSAPRWPVLLAWALACGVDSRWLRGENDPPPAVSPTFPCLSGTSGTLFTRRKLRVINGRVA